MSLPVYFLSRAQRTVPGRLAACGWHCAPDGTLAEPEGFSNAPALVFDDRAPLPDSPEPLAASLLRAADRLGAEAIILDFERTPDGRAQTLTRLLSARCRTAAPDRIAEPPCEPIFCFCPAAQTFPEFLENARGWIELRPVRETVRYALDGPMQPAGGTDRFSEQLQCRYRARTEENDLVLELFDTPETFRARFALLKDRFTAAVALINELTAFGLTAGPL